MGAVLRYLLNQMLAGVFAPFPLATFFINVTGSLSIGFLFALFAAKSNLDENWQLFLIVGFLGAFTTFSTFELETFQLFRDKNYPTAFLYAASSVLVGFAGVLAGVWLARKI